MNIIKIMIVTAFIFTGATGWLCAEETGTAVQAAVSTAPEVKIETPPVVPEVKPAEAPAVPDEKNENQPVIPDTRPADLPAMHEGKVETPPAVPDVKPVDAPAMPDKKTETPPAAPDANPVDVPAAIPEVKPADDVPAIPGDNAGKPSAVPEIRAVGKPETELSKAPGKKSDTIKWYGYEEGVARGKKEKKKIYINFYADWCHYCKVMEKDTFRNNSVVDYLNDNFVAIRINSDKDRKLAQNYQVTGLPSNWFLSENGDNIGNQPGYLPPDMMLPLLKYVHTDSYKKMNFSKFRENL